MFLFSNSDYSWAVCYHTYNIYICTTLLYIICLYVCMCLSVWQSTYTAEEGRCWRITVAVAGCLELKKKQPFFLDLMPVSRSLFSHPSILSSTISLSPLPSILNEMRKDRLLSAWPTMALLSAWAVYRCSLSGQTPPVGLSLWRGDEMWKLLQICRGGNKAWYPTDLTPLSSWYQSLTQISQPTGSNVSNKQKINIKYIKGCPSSSPYEINMT